MASHGVWVLGVLVFLVGFFWDACVSLPYQDAPPELLEKQAEGIHQAQIVLCLGLVIFVAGLAWLGLAKFLQRKKMKISTLQD